MDPGTLIAVLTAVLQTCNYVCTLAKEARAFKSECARLAAMVLKVEKVLQGIQPAVEASGAAARTRAAIAEALQVGGQHRACMGRHEGEASGRDLLRR